MKNFTQIDNKLFSLKGVSMEAKFLYISILSKALSWKFSAERLGKEVKKNKNTVNKWLQELEKKKLLKRIRVPVGKNKFNYTWYLYDLKGEILKVFGFKIENTDNNDLVDELKEMEDKKEFSIKNRGKEIKLYLQKKDTKNPNLITYKDIIVNIAKLNGLEKLNRKQVDYLYNFIKEKNEKKKYGLDFILEKVIDIYNFRKGKKIDKVIQYLEKVFK